MYRRPKFLEILLDIRQEMAREVDYDVDLFVESARTGKRSAPKPAKVRGRPVNAKTIKGHDPVAK